MKVWLFSFGEEYFYLFECSATRLCPCLYRGLEELREIGISHYTEDVQENVTVTTGQGTLFIPNSLDANPIWEFAIIKRCELVDFTIIAEGDIFRISRK